MVNGAVSVAELTSGYEFAPASFKLERERVEAYLEAVGGESLSRVDPGSVPPMAVAALAMSALGAGLALPPGVIHVSQELRFLSPVRIGESLVSLATVKRRAQRASMDMLMISITVINEERLPVLTGETSFILSSA